MVGDDSLKLSVTYQAAFHADVRKFRFAIHDPPIGPLPGSLALIADESSASYTCSGSASQTDVDTTTTITWTGGGNVPAARTTGGAPNSFQMVFNGVGGPTVTVGIIHGPGPGCDGTTVTSGPAGTITSTFHWDLSRPDTFDIGALPVEPNDPSFPAGSHSFAICPSPPTFTLPHCQIQWSTVAATFPPDATSAR